MAAAASAWRKLLIGLPLVLCACGGLGTPAVQAQPAAAPAQSAQQLTQAAHDALDAMLADYASGQPLQAQNALDAAMIGRQGLADQMRVSLSQEVQVRVNLRDIEASVNAGTVVISANWERRFLRLPGMAPALRSGRAVFMWQLRREGWRLTGLSGDSPFAP